MMQEFFSRRWGWEREKGLSPHPSPTSYLRPPTAIMLNVAGHGWHQLTNIFGHSVAPSGRPLTSLRSWRDCYARGTFLVTVGFRLAPNLLAALPPKHNSTRPRISQLRRLATSHPGIYILQKSTLRQNRSANHRFVAVLCLRTAACNHHLYFLFTCGPCATGRLKWPKNKNVDDAKISITASAARASGLPVDNPARRSTTGPGCSKLG